MLLNLFYATLAQDMKTSKTVISVLKLSILQTSLILRRCYFASGTKAMDKTNRPRTENDYLHKSLEAITRYHKHVIPHPKFCLDKWQEIIGCSKMNGDIRTNGGVHFVKLSDAKGSHQLSTPVEEPIIASFRKLSIDNLRNERNINDMQYDKMITSILSRLPSFSDETLFEAMVYSCLWPNKTPKSNRNCGYLWKLLDSECCKRASDWQLDKKLLVADILYHLNSSKQCLYTTDLIENLPDIILDNLTSSQLVHLLFVINVKRKVSSKLLENIERRLETVLPSISIEEVAVVALAYFKTGTKMRNLQVINLMFEHVTGAMCNINSIVLTAIVKNLRYSYRYENRISVVAFLNEASRNHVWKDNCIVASHICLLAGLHATYIPTLLENIIKDLPRFRNVRLKDLEKLLYTFYKFPHVDHIHIFEFFSKQMQIASKRVEIEKYPSAFLTCMMYLAYLGHFLHNEINYVMSKEFYKLVEQREVLEFKSKFATLDCLIEMGDPFYTGNRLDPQERSKILLSRRVYFTDKTCDNTFREDVTKRLSDSLRRLFEKEVPLVHILPHMSEPVFLIISDGNGKYWDPPTEFMDSIRKGEFTSPTDNREWVAIWPQTKKDFADHHCLMNTLSHVKEQHLTKLGFKVVKLCLTSKNHTTEYLVNYLKSLFKDLRWNIS